MVSVTHFSTNVHQQVNDNSAGADRRTEWTDCVNCLSKEGGLVEPAGVCHAPYLKKKKNNKTVYYKPWVLTANDFDFNIPECAYINKITFTAYIKSSGKLKVKAPYGRFNIYHGKNNLKTNRKNDTGWDDNIWFYNPNVNLSSSYKKVDYVLTGDEFRRRGFPISQLNDIIMGIDLRFYDSDSQDASDNVYVKYISCTIDYELPNHVMWFDDTSYSETNPRITYAGEEYIVEVNYSNQSNANCCVKPTRDITIDLPSNTEIIEVLEGNVNGNVWTVPCTPWKKSKLRLKLKDYHIGTDKIVFTHEDIGRYTYHLYSRPVDIDVGQVKAYPSPTMQKSVKSCIEYEAKVFSDEGIVTFDVDVDRTNHTQPDLTWSILDSSDTGVSINSSDNTGVTFNVPVQKATRIRFASCFIPSFSGDTSVKINSGSAMSDTAPYTVLDAPTFIIRNTPITTDDDRTTAEIILNPSLINFDTHRIASTTEIGATIIDCGVASNDSEMEISDCTLTASIYEKIDYIGMIPLEYHHYDPDSTFTNKEVDKSYKNKTYKGKEGIIEEDISLKFKIRPWQSPTLQGLVELDKPTAINANHKCFEGDPLNHRGWMVLSEAKLTRTNPLWYDAECKVDYITHDINTKFQIFKGGVVNDVDLPDMQVDKFELGSNLANGLDIFNIDTTGGFIFDDDNEDGVNNIFSLDEGQHLLINTLKPLTDVSMVRFDWYSNRNSELRENNISRIFRLRDSTGNSVFEYEYTDFSFDDDYVSCTTILRYKNNNGAWESLPNTVDLRTEIEYDPIADDNSIDSDFTDEVIDIDDVEVIDDEEDEFDESAYDPDNIAPEFDLTKYDISLMYGSSLIFKLNKNKLEVIDRGFNGNEFSKTDIELIGDSYTFEAYWVNNNHDGTTEDIISYVDVNLTESILSTQYSALYSDLIVSPFPIPHKRVVFTRESEEGTIFYLDGSQEPFKYMLEPFYQYYCGTDLVTRNGTSIFNLNNSYTYFYIENGLVRLGFNKFNARLYLSKWDIITKQWIPTHYFHMQDGTKFGLGEYSDDKITITAGTDTVFTIWRGHPYIMIQHPNDDIFIDANFNFAYSDSVDGVNYEYPLIHSFLNTDNLLPECIGSSKIDYKCISIEDDVISSGTDHTITVNVDTATNNSTQELNVDITPSTTDGTVHYIVDGVDIGEAEYPFLLNHTWISDGTHTVQAVYTGDDDDNIAISEPVTINVDVPEPASNTKADNGTDFSENNPTGKYKLVYIGETQFTYKDRKKWGVMLTRGGVPAPNMLVELQLPTGHTITRHTGADGKVWVENYDIDFVPGMYYLGGRFYENWSNGNVVSGKVLCEAIKPAMIFQAKPTFTYNAKNGKVSKGNNLIIKLRGVDGTGLEDKKITYTIGDGAKKTKTTNKKGNIHIPCNSVGSMKITVSFTGSLRYKAHKDTINVKVVK